MQKENTEIYSKIGIFAQKEVECHERNKYPRVLKTFRGSRAGPYFSGTFVNFAISDDVTCKTRSRHGTEISNKYQKNKKSKEKSAKFKISVGTPCKPVLWKMQNLPFFH